MGHQRLRQGHTFFGAARECAHDGVRVQVQAVQGFLHTLLPVPGVVRLDDGLQSVQVQPVFARQVLVSCCNNARQTYASCFENSSVRVQVGLLRHIGDAQPRLHLQGAIVGFFHSREDFEHGGLARAVAADKAHTFSGFKSEVGVVEKSDVSKGQLGVE